MLVPALPLYAQVPAHVSDFNRQVWFSYSGDHAFSRQWGFHFDAQVRRHPFITKWQQYQVRPGVNFQLNDSIALTAGYMFSKSYPYGDYPDERATPEHRIYEQLEMEHKAVNLEWGHRFRLEQRFAGDVVVDSGRERVADWRYRNRFRYRLNVDIPLAGEADQITWYLPLSNEFFLNFGANSARVFNQNRTYAGIGYKLAETAELEVGFLHQILAQSNGRVREYNSTIIVSFSSDVPFRRSH